MKKFQIDFEELKQSVVPDSRVPLKGNEHRLVRVAFDLYRFKEGNVEELWQVQSSDDGEFLVRTYDLSDEEEKKAEYKWMVELDKKGENLTIAYRNIPLYKIAVQKYGIKTAAEVQTFQRAIYSKLNTDEDFTYGFVNKLSSEKQELLKEAGFISNVEVDPALAALEEKLSKKAAGPVLPEAGLKELYKAKQDYEHTIERVINIFRDIRSKKDDKWLKFFAQLDYGKESKSPHIRQLGFNAIGNRIMKLEERLNDSKTWKIPNNFSIPELERMTSNTQIANEEIYNRYKKLLWNHPLWANIS